MTISRSQPNALGDSQADIKVYIANKPQFDFPDTQSDYHPLGHGEIAAIGAACGNGWRKVFNVYAKWLFSGSPVIYPQASHHATWQQFRDHRLLQANSRTALVFTEPANVDSNTLNVVMGRTYAKTLPFADQLQWINSEFAILTPKNLVVCPYFDYRQLSDQKIGFLINTIREHLNKGFCLAR